MSRYDHSQAWQKPNPIPSSRTQYNEPIPHLNGTDIPMTTAPQFQTPAAPIEREPSRAMDTGQLVLAAQFGREHPDPAVRAIIGDLLEHADHMDHVIRAPDDATRLYDARRHVAQLQSHAEHLGMMVDDGQPVGSRKRALLVALNWAVPVLTRVTSENVGRHTQYT